LYRLYTCEECHGYIKAIDLRKAGSDVLLPRDLTREKLEHARYVVSNCHFHTRNLPERFPGLSVRRFHMVRIGLDLKAPFWSPVPQPRKEGTLRIFAAGRLVAVKAFHLLIDACNAVAGRGISLSCRIAGDGPLRASLERRIAGESPSPAIELIGQLDEQRIAAEIAGAHLFALTSLSEGTPMCLIEAMAKGRPVVAPRITGIPEVVEEETTGLLFAAGSSDACAHALERIERMSDEALSAMGMAGRRKAEREFDLHLNVNNLIALHNEEMNALQ